MKEQFMPKQMDQAQEEALCINNELDDVLASGRYTKKQETADLIIKKRELEESFDVEWEKAIKSLPEGEKPVVSLNKKAIVNMYVAGHVFGKDFTMKNVVLCLIRGKDVTDQIKSPKKGTRYLELRNPEDAGFPGRFVVPSESGTALAEHVANWNQECEFKFRHGKLSPIIKKSDLPDWLVKVESSFFVLIEKNEIFDHEQKRFNPPRLQCADGPTEDDSEGSWLISTVHFGQPSTIKPRPPKEPCWDKIKKDSTLFMDEIIKYLRATSDYQKAYEIWNSEEVVFVDLEEKGVGQKGIKQESRIDDPHVAELVCDNKALRQMLMRAIGEINTLKSEIKGLKTRMDKNKK